MHQLSLAVVISSINYLQTTLMLRERHDAAIEKLQVAQLE